MGSTLKGEPAGLLTDWMPWGWAERQQSGKDGAATTYIEGDVAGRVVGEARAAPGPCSVCDAS